MIEISYTNIIYKKSRLKGIETRLKKLTIVTTW